MIAGRPDRPPPTGCPGIEPATSLAGFSTKVATIILRASAGSTESASAQSTSVSSDEWH
jgi:hypothetical protein